MFDFEGLFPHAEPGRVREGQTRGKIFVEVLPRRDALAGRIGHCPDHSCDEGKRAENEQVPHEVVNGIRDGLEKFGLRRARPNDG